MSISCRVVAKNENKMAANRSADEWAPQVAHQAEHSTENTNKELKTIEDFKCVNKILTHSTFSVKCIFKHLKYNN